jgi:hypothetical protein
MLPACVLTLLGDMHSLGDFDNGKSALDPAATCRFRARKAEHLAQSLGLRRCPRSCLEFQNYQTPRPALPFGY